MRTAKTTTGRPARGPAPTSRRQGPRWPIVVRMQDIERHASQGGRALAGRRITAMPIPPFLTTTLATFCAGTGDRVIALSYDDGPDPRNTPGILDELAARGARATFFVLAGQAERHPDLVRRIVADGHELALHGIDHRSLLTMTTAAAVRTVARARATVERIAGVRVRLYRPPYGEYTWAQTARLRAHGLETVIWSGDTQDWASGDAVQVLDRAKRLSSEGAILLMHDHRADPEATRDGPVYDRTVVLRALLAHLDERGFCTATVSGMLKGRARIKSIARYGRDGRHSPR